MQIDYGAFKEMVRHRLVGVAGMCAAVAVGKYPDFPAALKAFLINTGY
jgi:hypothetical protein